MTINLQKIVEHWPAKVLALAAALLLFLFNRIDTMQQKTFSVPLRLVTDTALVPAENYTHRVKVSIRGSQEVVAGLSEDSIEAVADFSNRQSEGIFRTPIQIVKKTATAEAETLEITVDPIDMSLRLERRLVKTVNVLATFAGQPGKNFELAGFRVTPSIVTIDGPRSRVDKVTQIRTEPIDLRGKTDDFTLRVNAVTDTPLINFPYGSTVEIQGTMKSSLSSLVIENVQPQPVNLDAGLVLKSPLSPVSVKLRGTVESLSPFTTNGKSASVISIVADFTGFTVPGEVPSLALKAALPAGVELVEISPPIVSIFLERKP